MSRKNEHLILLELFLIAERGLIDEYVELRMESNWSWSEDFNAELCTAFRWDDNDLYWAWRDIARISANLYREGKSRESLTSLCF
jgi:hypothetical protein